VTIDEEQPVISEYGGFCTEQRTDMIHVVLVVGITSSLERLSKMLIIMALADKTRIDVPVVLVLLMHKP